MNENTTQTADQRHQDKIRGSLIAGAIGDALGYPIEFDYRPDPRAMTTLDSKGLISDDTQMTLFTAVGLLWRETRLAARGIALTPVQAIWESYLDWYETQIGSHREHAVAWIRDIPELRARRSPGGTCLSALRAGKEGTIEKPLNTSKGCGGLMRIAPIGLRAPTPETAGQLAAEASALTHGHPLGIIPSYVAAAWINILANTDKSLTASLSEALSIATPFLRQFPSEDTKKFLELMSRATKLATSDQTDQEAIRSLGEGWVAEEALAIAAFSCLRHPDNITDALIAAVNHGGDSDSTGSIAGNIIGAHLGCTAIPQSEVAKLELHDLILEIADDLATRPVPVSTEGTHDDAYWISKYILIHRDEKLRGAPPAPATDLGNASLRHPVLQDTPHRGDALIAEEDFDYLQRTRTPEEVLTDGQKLRFFAHDQNVGALVYDAQDQLVDGYHVLSRGGLVPIHRSEVAQKLAAQGEELADYAEAIAAADPAQDWLQLASFWTARQDYERGAYDDCAHDIARAVVANLLDIDPTSLPHVHELIGRVLVEKEIKSQSS